MRRMTTTLVIGMLALATTATADPIAITAGALWATPDDGAAWLAGPAFSFVGIVIPSDGRIDPLWRCQPCLPGQALSAGASLGGSALPGRVNGTREVGSLVDLDALALEWTGTTQAPAVGGLPFVTVPVTLTGWWTDQGALHAVQGAGLASIWFTAWQLDAQTSVWGVSRVEYAVSPPHPVPEPATVVLCLTGGVVGWLRRRYVC